MAHKKIMLLGGLRYLLPVIDAAHAQGYRVITADYLPDNIAHRYSDDYVNVSIIDREAVLEAAMEKRIDGIMSFACDPGVVSAAYVQERMGLPSFGPFESVEILQNKDRFRAFLSDNGFNVPRFNCFRDCREALDMKGAIDYPVIVKPVDSAGSKGVSRVSDEEGLVTALDKAFAHSISGRVIVESFLEKRGCSSDTDCFSVDGRLTFVNFNSQRFDAAAANPYAPAAFSWPSTFSKDEEDYLASEIQRLITLLGMKTAIFNVETMVAADGTPYIMEFTPRAGGNRLSEVLRLATGVDMITAITRWAVGDPPGRIGQSPINGHWAEIILHANDAGPFLGLHIDRSIPVEIIEEDLWVSPGDMVEPFGAANNTIGTLILRSRSASDLENAMSSLPRWLAVQVGCNQQR